MIPKLTLVIIIGIKESAFPPGQVTKDGGIVRKLYVVETAKPVYLLLFNRI